MPNDISQTRVLAEFKLGRPTCFFLASTVAVLITAANLGGPLSDGRAIVLMCFSCVAVASAIAFLRMMGWALRNQPAIWLDQGRLFSRHLLGVESVDVADIYAVRSGPYPGQIRLLAKPNRTVHIGSDLMRPNREVLVRALEAAASLNGATG